MRLDNRRRSTNVEDRRSSGMGMGGKGAIGGGLGIVIFLIISLLGGDPGAILNNTNIINPGSNVEYVETEKDKELAEFVSVVLATTEDVWSDIFKEMGYEYTEPSLVLFKDQVQSACGVAGASTGPFYCPGDAKLYIDLSFFDELSTRFKAPGDFAMAYVIAHEVGHHVQTQFGVTEQLNKARQNLSQKEFNKVSVRFELQADYLAGVWGNRVKGMGLLEAGDIEEALVAASAIGDDRIQKEAQGRVVPDSFTHGTSEQRRGWLLKGYKTGNLDQWDTFNNAD